MMKPSESANCRLLKVGYYLPTETGTLGAVLLNIYISRDGSQVFEKDLSRL